ncbi:PREDICTED: uncharacterized protein LOC106818475 [Priapulus caudatus]|uniref:Uncharacterized protein LOC106818475 n=1 Tax=Priapulus caudatus TaxID=37621 RepID=A0ABM1F2J3_PRICU|nr:PREDICTED: uncharacterized protein LOC106818475 [Priapulus caudatus]
MIACDNMLCKSGMWFHLDCMGITESTIPDGEWFCSDECRASKSESPCLNEGELDHVLEYSKSVLWRGLLDRAQRDVVREGDGAAQISMWRISMPEFWLRRHHKYLILGHRLLAGVAGFLPKRLAMDTMWNRTINLHGGAGHNIPMDRVCEFLNDDFKEILKHSRGKYTDAQVQRCGRIVGPLGNALDDKFSEAVEEAAG